MMRVTRDDQDVVSKYTFFSIHGQDLAGVLTGSITFMALLVSAAYLSGMQLVGQAIECWCPAQLSSAMCNYTKSFCWISQQYVIDYDSDIMTEEEVQRQMTKRVLDFYPMVPFILLSLAFILRLPHFLYGCLHGEAGLNIHSLLKSSVNSDLSHNENVHEVSRSMLFHLQTYHPLHDDGGASDERGRRNLGVVGLARCLGRVLTGCLFFFLGERLGTYQTGLYLLSRLATLVLTAAAFPALSFALNEDFTTWGWTLFKEKVMNVDLSDSSDISTKDKEFYFFPRETLCDFKVRQLQNVHTYTVQCVLPINMWSEKVFLCLWYWLLFLLLLNLHSYLYWFRKMLFASSRRDVVLKHLTLAGVKVLGDEKDPENSQRARQFASQYLTYDCVLAINMLEMAAGNQFAGEVVLELFRKFVSEKMQVEEPPLETT